MSYYSTQNTSPNGSNPPGNFGVSNTYMPSMTAIASSNQAGSGINNAGIVREVPSSAIRTTTNVFGVSLNTDPQTGATNHNSVEEIVNTNSGPAVGFDKNVINQGTVNIGLYKNYNPYGYQN
jgi:hypothetical protein